MIYLAFLHLVRDTIKQRRRNRLRNVDGIAFSRVVYLPPASALGSMYQNVA